MAKRRQEEPTPQESYHDLLNRLSSPEWKQAVDNYGVTEIQGQQQPQFEGFDLDTTGQVYADWSPQEVEDARAFRQPNSRAILNSIVQIGSTIVGDAVSGVGYLGELGDINDITQGTETEWGNWLVDLGQSIKQKGEEVAPVYASQSALTTFAPWDGEWWASNIPSIGSTLALAIPAAGGVGLVSKFGKALGIARNMSAATGKAIAGISSGIISRHIENMMESKEVFDNAYAEALKQGRDEETAKQVAGRAASNSYNANYVNLLTDIPQYLALFGVKLPGFGMKTGAIGAVGGSFASEAAEEATQFIIQQESERGAKLELGEKDDSTFGQRFTKYLQDPGLQTAAFFGGLGGAVFGAVGQIIDRADKSPEEARQEAISDIAKKAVDTGDFTKEKQMINAAKTEDTEALGADPEVVQRNLADAEEVIKHTEKVFNSLIGDPYQKDKAKLAADAKILEQSLMRNDEATAPIAARVGQDQFDYHYAKMQLEALKGAKGEGAKALRESLNAILAEERFKKPEEGKKGFTPNAEGLTPYVSTLKQLANQRVEARVKQGQVNDAINKFETPEGREELAEQLAKQQQQIEKQVVTEAQESKTPEQLDNYRKQYPNLSTEFDKIAEAKAQEEKKSTSVNPDDYNMPEEVDKFISDRYDGKPFLLQSDLKRKGFNTLDQFKQHIIDYYEKEQEAQTTPEDEINLVEELKSEQAAQTANDKVSEVQEIEEYYDREQSEAELALQEDNPENSFLGQTNDAVFYRIVEENGRQYVEFSGFEKRPRRPIDDAKAEYSNIKDWGEKNHKWRTLYDNNGNVVFQEETGQGGYRHNAEFDYEALRTLDGDQLQGKAVWFEVDQRNYPTYEESTKTREGYERIRILARVEDELGGEPLTLAMVKAHTGKLVNHPDAAKLKAFRKDVYDKYQEWKKNKSTLLTQTYTYKGVTVTTTTTISEKEGLKKAKFKSTRSDKPGKEISGGGFVYGEIKGQKLPSTLDDFENDYGVSLVESLGYNEQSDFSREEVGSVKVVEERTDNQGAKTISLVVTLKNGGTFSVDLSTTRLKVLDSIEQSNQVFRYQLPGQLEEIYSGRFWNVATRSNPKDILRQDEEFVLAVGVTQNAATLPESNGAGERIDVQRDDFGQLKPGAVYQAIKTSNGKYVWSRLFTKRLSNESATGKTGLFPTWEKHYGATKNVEETSLKQIVLDLLRLANNPEVWKEDWPSIRSEVQSIIRFPKKNKPQDKGPDFNQNLASMFDKFREQGQADPALGFYNLLNLDDRPIQIDSRLVNTTVAGQNYNDLIADRLESDLNAKGAHTHSPKFLFSFPDLSEEAQKSVPENDTIEKFDENDEYEELNSDEVRFRLADSVKQYKKWDQRKELSWFKSRFPDVPISVFKSIKAFGNKEAYGMFYYAGVAISEAAASGTTFHEAFHVVFNLGLNDNQRQTILSEARKKYGKDISDNQLEEYLADEFMEYIQSQSTTLSNRIKRFFNRLWNLIKFAVTNKLTIDYLFDRIDNRAFSGITLDGSRFTPKFKLLKSFRENGGTLHEQRMRVKESLHFFDVIVGDIAFAEQITLEEALNKAVVNPDVFKGEFYETQSPDGKKYRIPSIKTRYERQAKNIAGVEGKKREEFDRVINSLESGEFANEIRRRLSSRGVYVVEATQNEDDAVFENEEQFLESWQKKSLQISPIENLSGRLKRFLDNVPKQKTLASGESVPILSSLGFQLFHDGKFMYADLQSRIGGAVDVADMIQKLEEQATRFPHYQWILDRVSESKALRTELFRMAQKVHPVFIDVVKDNSKYGIKTAGTESLARAILSDWHTTFYNTRENRYLGASGVAVNKSELQSAWNKIKSKPTPENFSEFLAKFGITVDSEVLANASNDNKLGEITSLFGNFITAFTNASEDTMPTIFDDQQIRKFAEAVSSYYPITYQSAHINIEGNREYEWINSSYLGKMMNHLKQGGNAFWSMLRSDVLYNQLLENNIIRPETWKKAQWSVVGGIKHHKGRGTGYTSFSDKDTVITFLSMFKEGWYPTSINSGSSPVLSAIQLTEGRDNYIKNRTEVLNRAFEIANAEWARANREDTPEGWKNYTPESYAFFGLTAGQAPSKVAIQEKFQSEYTELRAKLEDLELIKDGKLTFDNTLDADTFLQDFVYNFNLRQAEIILLMQGDPNFYKHDKSGSKITDFFKRAREVWSPGNYLDVSAEFKTEDGRIIKFHRDQYNLKVLRDVETPSPQQEEIRENVFKVVKSEQIAKGKTEEQAENIARSEADSIANEYSKSSLTDAQSYIDLYSYRLRMLGEQRWTNEMQRAYDVLVTGQSTKSRNLKLDGKTKNTKFQPIKPFYYALQAYKTLVYPMQNKDSEFLLIPEFANGNPKLEAILEDMGYSKTEVLSDASDIVSSQVAFADNIEDYNERISEPSDSLPEYLVNSGLGYKQFRIVEIPIDSVDISKKNKGFSGRDSDYLKDTLDKEVQRIPVLLNDKNQLVEGWHRLHSLKTLGKTTVKAYVPVEKQYSWSFDEEGRDQGKYTDKVSFDTAIKVALDAPFVGDTLETATPIQLNWSDWRRQMETPEHHLDTDSRFGTQTMKLIIADLADDAVFPRKEASLKKGVEYVFQNNPALAKIGDKQQYSAYLETIFPNSTMKNIVFHGSFSKKILRFDKEKFLSGEGAMAFGKGFYFTEGKNTAVFYSDDIYASTYNPSRMDEGDILAFRSMSKEDRDEVFTGKIYPVVLDMRNPANWENISEKKQLELKKGVYGKNDSVIHKAKGFTQLYGNVNKREALLSEKYENEFALEQGNFGAPDDLVTPEIRKNLIERNKEIDYELSQMSKFIEGETHYIIPEPEQIHILGSEQDIEGFKDFVKSVPLNQVTGAEIKEQYEKLVIADIVRSSNQLMARFSIREGDEIKINKPEFIKILREEAAQRQLGDQYLDALDEIDGDTAIPLFHPLHSYRIESLISALFKNNITKQKFITGVSLFNVSSYGIEDVVNENGEIVEDKAPKILWNKDGSIDAIECYAPVYSSYLEKFRLDNGKIDIDRIRREEPELLEGLVYRIPTEDKYSMFNIRIKGFLPDTEGGGIILPHEVTTIAGLDFDIDKTYGFFHTPGKSKLDFNRSTKEGKEIYKEYQSQLNEIHEQKQGRYDLLKSTSGIRKEIKNLQDEIISLSKDYELEEDAEIREIYALEYDKLQRQLLTLQSTLAEQKEVIEDVSGSEQKLIDEIATLKEKGQELRQERNSRVEALEVGYEAFESKVKSDNEKLTLMKSILSHPSMTTAFLRPGGFDTIRSTARRIQQMRKDEGTGDTVTNPNTLIKMVKRINSGAALTGIAADYNSSKARWQKYNLSIKDEFGFRFFGKSYKNLSTIDVDDPMNKTGVPRKISRNIAEVLASAVDNSKEPLAEIYNLNSYTADVAMSMLATGVPLKVVMFFLSQPSIVRYVNDYFNTGSETPMQIPKFPPEIGVGEDGKPSIKELTDGIEAGDIAGENQEKFLKAFVYYKKMVSSVGDLVIASKVPDNGAGPMIADTVARERMYNPANIAKGINGATEFLGSRDINDPVPSFHNAFVRYGVDQALDVFADLGFPRFNGKSGLKLVLDNIEGKIKGSNLTAKELAVVYQNFMDYLASASDIFSSEAIAELHKNLGNRVAYTQDMMKRGKIPMYDFLNRLVVDDNKIIRFRSVVSIHKEELDDFRQSWAEMLKDDTVIAPRKAGGDYRVSDLAKDLVKYSFFRSGFRLKPMSGNFSHLQPIEFYTDTVEGREFNKSIKNQVEAQANATNPMAYARFVSQFVRNNFRTLWYIPEVDKNQIWRDKNGNVTGISVDPEELGYSEYVKYISPVVTDPLGKRVKQGDDVLFKLIDGVYAPIEPLGLYSGNTQVFQVYDFGVDSLNNPFDVDTGDTKKANNTTESLHKIYTGKITSLNKNQVFVFGSNLRGFHGEGSAGFASFGVTGNKWKEFGYAEKLPGWKGKWNVKGQGEGLQQGTEGMSYALPTVSKPGAKRSLTPEQISVYVRKFYEEARKNPDLEFLIAYSADTRNLNGYTPQEMADIFTSDRALGDWGSIPLNVVFEAGFYNLMYPQLDPGTEGTRESVDPKKFTNFTGGAKGADTVWKEVGSEYGIGRTRDFVPADLDKLTSEQMDEVEWAYQEAWRQLGRSELAEDTYEGKLVRRDYLQAKKADAVFAISSLVETIDKTNDERRTVVKGGTGYAVQMAINLGKPVYVYDQTQFGWFTYTDSKWKPTTTPVLTENFAGIGTRVINEAGRQAIENVFSNTFGPKQSKTKIPEDHGKRVEIKSLENKTIKPEMVRKQVKSTVENIPVEVIESMSAILTTGDYVAQSDIPKYGESAVRYTRETQSEILVSEAEWLRDNKPYSDKLMNIYLTREGYDGITMQEFADKFLENSGVYEYYPANQLSLFEAEETTQGVPTLSMQPDNIVKIKAGLKTITNRTELLEDQAYKLPDGSIIGLNYMGTAKVNLGTVERGVLVTDTMGNTTTWDLDDFARAEGFDSWSDFANNNKFSTNFVSGRQTRHVYQIIPVDMEEETVSITGEIVLNPEQQEAADKIRDYILSKNPKDDFFVLEGKAGTGKTTVLSKVLGEVGGQHIVVAALAHKAKSVLQRKLKDEGVKVKGYSVAGLLGMNMNEETGEFEINRFSRALPPIAMADVIVIDEASMINEEALNLINNMKQDDAKVIFAGDVGQLPPIRKEKSDNNSPAFESKAKAKLETRVRQGEESPILPYADYYWNNSQSKTPAKAPVPSSARKTRITPNGNLMFAEGIQKVYKKIVSTFKQGIEENNPNKIKIVAYRNDTRRSLNSQIRESLFGSNAKEFEKNDLIMMYDSFETPQVKIENSQEFQIKEAELKQGVKLRNGKKVDVWNLEIEADTPTGETVSVELSVLAQNSKQIHRAYVSSLFAEARSLAKGEFRSNMMRAAWAEARRYGNVDYAYAITSHKSQGSTYETVVVLEDDIMGVGPTSNKTKSQSMYTAITRASKTAVIISRANSAKEVATSQEILEEGETIQGYDEQIQSLWLNYQSRIKAKHPDYTFSNFKEDFKDMTFEEILEHIKECY